MTVEQVQKRLELLGAQVQEEDACALSYALEKVQQEVKSHCGFSEIPQVLSFAVVDLTAVEFLQSRGAFGDEEQESMIRTLQEGDTSITYMTASEGGNAPQWKQEGVLARMREAAEKQLIPYWSIQW